MQIEIDFGQIKDQESFHALFKEVMGFPDFYGMNYDAWIDCMSYIDEPSAGMSRITVAPDESLNIVIKNTETAIKHCPEMLLGFFDVVAFVNRRFSGSGTATRLVVTAT